MLSVQINLKSVAKNILTIKKKLKPDTKFCAVVKANAYGFGVEKVSKYIEPLVDCFAVANLKQGIELRELGIKKDILIFGITNDIKSAIKHNLIITLNNLEEAVQFAKDGLQPRIHIAINTDMNRFGLNSIHELRTAIQLLANAKVEGLYTHLAYEENNLEKVNQALQSFKKYTYLFKKYFPQAIIHAGCSGVINYQPAHFDMIRIGKGMYGGVDGTVTALTIKSKIVAIKKIKSGETVGYNGEYTAPKPRVIGIVAGGYSQGILTEFQGASFVTVDKKVCPIIGRICMDCFFIDVTEIDKPLGKIVSIISDHHGQTIMDVSRQTKQIACKILCGTQIN